MKNKKIILGIGILIIAVIAGVTYLNSNSTEAKFKKYKVYEASVARIKDTNIKSNKSVENGKNFISDDKGNKLNIKSEISKKFEIDGYKLTDGYLSVSYKTPDYCVLSLNVEATKNMPNNYNFLVKFYDSDNKELGHVVLSVPDMESNGKGEFLGETFLPIIDADHISIESLIFND